jgi:hypothetical protein
MKEVEAALRELACDGLTDAARGTGHGNDRH